MDGAHRFGRYKVTSTLGSGAMGHVYAAVDEVLGRSVAVKTLRGGATGLGARMLDERFRLEARAVAALNHPGIVQVYDIDLAADPPYLVMERVAGPSLKEQLEAGPMSERDLRALGIQIARALAFAHAAGIVHRDVKPANILAAGAGQWKLADFGVAHVPDSSLTMTGQFLGSPAYAPPEALVRGQSTAAGDVFGLDATLYYGAVGRWPRAEATTAGLLAPVPSVGELVPSLPADLIALIDRAVEIEPDLRPAAAELADALARASLPAVSSTPPPAVQTVFVPDQTSAGAPARAPSAPSPVGTEVVPDAPIEQAARPEPSAPSPSVETVFVADSTHGASPRPVRPPTSSRSRWMPAALGAGALALALLVLAARGGRTPTAGGPGTPVQLGPASRQPETSAPEALSPGAPSMEAPPEEPPPTEEPSTEEPASEQPTPGLIRAVTPPIADHHAAKDWEKVVDALYDHDFGKARRRLDEWERRWGESAETRSLRQQLDALPADTRGDD